MNDLVILHEGKPMVSSQLVAEKFGKVHRNLIRDIEKLECSEDFKVLNFEHCSFKNKMNRSYDGYMMTKDGFAFLCMGFTGKKAAAWKEKYIKAFNQMEKRLAKESEDLQWKQARIQSKQVRKDVTDIIKQFVDYASNQGSKSADRYYASITKMEYAALELLQFNEKVPTGFRDTLDSMDLSFLMTAEHVAKNSLLQGMKERLHYKEIYILAKDKVNSFADTVKIPKVKGE